MNTLVVCNGCGESYLVRTNRVNGSGSSQGYCAIVQKKVGWEIK